MDLKVNVNGMKQPLQPLNVDHLLVVTLLVVQQLKSVKIHWVVVYQMEQLVF